MMDGVTITFHYTEGHEVCQKCGGSLWMANWGRGMLWLCLHCMELIFEEGK